MSGIADRLKVLDDVKQQRLESLDKMQRGIKRLVDWLAIPENKSMFSGKIYGPILMEVTVEDEMHCRFLEQVCASKTFILWPATISQYYIYISFHVFIYKFWFRDSMWWPMAYKIRVCSTKASMKALHTIILLLSSWFPTLQFNLVCMQDESKNHMCGSRLVSQSSEIAEGICSRYCVCHLLLNVYMSVGNLWARFVVEKPEDQDTLIKESKFHCKFEPSITCFNGNTEAPILHPHGEASQYLSWASCSPDFLHNSWSSFLWICFVVNILL